MPYRKIAFTPGVNVELTPTLNSSGWSGSQLIRFKNGLPEKLGGWEKLCSTPVVGVARDVHPWQDLATNKYLGIGTNERLQVYLAGAIYDITPLRDTVDLTPDFSTTLDSALITVKDVANDAQVGDWINLTVKIAVGGLVLYGYYQVVSIINADSYNIMSPTVATSTVANGGAVPLITTTNASADASILLVNNGLSVGEPFLINIATIVGGITFEGQYLVQSITDADNFVITADVVASSDDSGSVNGGNAQIEYLLPSGLVSQEYITGYGTGLYGAGLYGVSTSQITSPLRVWYLDNWGENLIGCFNGSALYQWIPPVGANLHAEVVSGAPTMMNVVFVSTGAQIAVALGAEVAGTQDPLLVRWCDVSDLNDWTATSVNQAGSFRLPTGSAIVGGLSNGIQNLIWTDTEFWSMSYMGPPLVYGFQRISSGCGLISGHAVGTIGTKIMWMGSNNFYEFDGSGVTPVNCPVWDYVFKNLDSFQAAKIFCAPNSYFAEMVWYFPSLSGAGEIDSYVKYSTIENTWDYGLLVRTAWSDQSVLGPPLGIDVSGLIQVHEISPDADGAPLISSIQSGYWDLADGEEYVFIRDMIPDFKWTGENPAVTITLFVTDFPDDLPNVYGPYVITPSTKFVPVGARGRQVSYQVAGSGIGSWWRQGAVRFMVIPDGRMG